MRRNMKFSVAALLALGCGASPNGSKSTSTTTTDFAGVYNATYVGTYVVTSPSSRQTKDEHRAPPAEGTGTATSAASRAPARYHVTVSARPREAQFDLDGKSMGTGTLDQELAADGTEHALIVTAAGFVPARLTFRDSPPPERVTLEPVAAPPVKAVEATAGAAEPARSAHAGAHAHPHGGEHAAKTHPAVTAGKPAGPARTENNAAIIDD